MRRRERRRGRPPATARPAPPGAPSRRPAEAGPGPRERHPAMPFTASLRGAHPPHAESIREALDDLVEVLNNPPKGAAAIGNRQACDLEGAPDRVRRSLDSTWFYLTEEGRPSYCPPARTYVECLEVVLRRLAHALDRAGLTSL